MRAALILALGATVYIGYKFFPRAFDFDYNEIAAGSGPRAILDNNGEPVIIPASNSRWNYPARAAIYIDAVSAAEDKYGIPRKLLGRLLYQESRYRPDIIYGGKANYAGAVGIAQIVPKWHPGVNAADPWISIDYAGRYLSQLYNQFGAWQLALAAYNTGPGNLNKAGRVIAKTSLETRNYVAQIYGDVIG